MKSRFRSPILIYSLLTLIPVSLTVLIMQFVVQRAWSAYLLVSLFLIVINTILIIYPWLNTLFKQQTLIQPVNIYTITSSGYILGAIFLVSGGQSRSLRYVLTPDALPAFTLALFTVTIGLVSYLLSYYLTLGTQNYDISFSQSSSRIKSSLRSFDLTNRKIFLLALGITTAIGLLGYGLFVQSSGGIAAIVTNIHSRTLLRTTDYYRLLFQFLQATTFLWLIFDTNALKKISFWGFFAFNIYTMATLGSAAPIILFCIFILSIKLSLHRPSGNPFAKLSRYLIQALFLLLLVFILLIGRIAWREASVIAVRNVSTDLSVDLIAERALSYEATEIVSSVLGGANLASIESLARVVDSVPTQIDFLYGKTFYWTLLLPIPRAVWPEKPVTTIGIYLKRQLEYADARAGGVPASWLGELYLNGGLFGVIIGQLAFGYLSARAVQWFHRHRGSHFARLHYVNFVIIFTFYLTKTEFKTGLNRAVGFGLAFLLVHFLIKKYVSPNVTNAYVTKVAFSNNPS
ncbi:MAG: O-antigen polysaccharide polymerase Wzy [Chloroflexota bacterium]